MIPSPRGVGTVGWHALDARLRQVRAHVLARRGYWRYTPGAVTPAEWLAGP